MMQLFEQKSACFGCGACRTACPHDAISMTADEEGFVYPTIHSDRCVDCGLCQSVCPIGDTAGNRPPFGMAFLSAAADRRDSSSGGAFPALAADFWAQHPGAPVWGAVLTEDLTVAHRCVTAPDELPLLQGSKYVQSDLADAYAQILAQLKEGLSVLFSGTPCQCAGLARLAKDCRDRLFLVDLVCNGVASPLVWKRYLTMEAETHGCPVSAYSFRNRRYYMGRGISCTLSDGRVLERSHPEDLFSSCYQRNLISRSSCYQCPYTCAERVSDLTLGDFHGLEKLDPDFSDCGASLVLPHTELGLAYCERLSAAGKCRKFAVEQCLQPRLETPPKGSPLRKILLRDLLVQPPQVFMLKYKKMLFPSMP